jgi:hypothetical protein
LITHEQLKEALSYDAETGLFTWAQRRTNGAEGLAGSNPDGRYITISIKRKRYYAHRLAWFFVHGEWPKNQIDHINGIKTDNRIANLREITRAENQQNQRQAHKDAKTTRLLGACRCTFTKRWQAHIQVNGKQKNLGRFDTAEEAHAAYLAAKRELHPFGEVAK